MGSVSIPGAFTPTEVVEAYKMGADYVKLFPVGVFGIKYLQALIAPINHIPIIAVGGIGVDNIHDFLTTGISGVGIGSSIVNQQLINERKWDEITVLEGKLQNKLRIDPKGE